jgi:hypothetical protein
MIWGALDRLSGCLARFLDYPLPEANPSETNFRPDSRSFPVELVLKLPDDNELRLDDGKLALGLSPQPRLICPNFH